MRAHGVALVACLLGGACADDGGSAGDGAADGGTGDGGATGDDGGGDDDDGAADALFDPTRVIEVEIELPEADWDTIRRQERTILDIFSPGCLEEPFASPFTYVSGTVTVDGTTVTNVGVRKKGFLGSLDDERPSLKLKFDEYVQGQLLHGLERMTLNNNKQDPSAIHQCLGYAVFADAGVPASRCNFAHVTVNGTDLGIYSHVEGVKKRFLRRHFDDDEGQLYEGTLSDFRVGWTGTFEQKTNKDAPYDRGDIDALVAALEQPDDQLLAALEPILDVDQFLSFWATEVLVGHWDGYANNTNNYFAYHDPVSGKFHFIPWGIDDILTDGDEGPALRSVFSTGYVSHRLYGLPQTRDRYVARLQELLASVWDEAALLAEVDRMTALIGPYTGPTIDPGVAAVREFISGQRGRIEAELAGGPPSWDEPPRDELCFTELGMLDATFDTTFGSIGTQDPFDAGTGTLGVDVPGMPIAPTMVGAASGFDPDNPGSSAAIVQLVGLLPDDKAAVLFAEIQPDLFTPGASFEVDWSNAFVALVEIDLMTDEDRMIGVVAGGLVELEMAETTDGAAVTGTISGPLVDFPF